MAFIVMEGDNGTGKDTIADFLQNNYSFSIISRLPDISDLEHQAKNLSGISRINTFIKYNRICGMRAESISSGCLVRYWISTLAAAFADNIMNLCDVLKKAEYCKKIMPAPDLVIRLKCSHQLRINRIINRRAAGGSQDDDISNIRADKYSDISKKIIDISGYKIFEIDTSSHEPEIIAGIIAKTAGNLNHGI